MTDFNSQRHVSYEQRKKIVEFMRMHVDFATGRLRTLDARETSKKLWNDLTIMLNKSNTGVRKTPHGWSRYWSDYKNKLKNKVSQNTKTDRLHHLYKPLSKLEKLALKILLPEKTYQYPDTDFNDESSDCNSLSGYSSKYSDNGTAPDRSREGVYPKWFQELEKKRVEADFCRAKAEEQRSIASVKNAEAAIIQADALKRLADAATIQAEAFVKISSLLEKKTMKESEPFM